MSNQKNSLVISSMSPPAIKLESIKKYQTPANNNHVASSKIGYIALTFALHCLHFHLLNNHEKIGIRSIAWRSLLQLPQWLLHPIIQPSQDLILWIITEEKLQKRSQNKKSVMIKNVCMYKYYFIKSSILK